MATQEWTAPPKIWISCTVIHFMIFIFNLYISGLDRQKRQQWDLPSAPKYMSFFSNLCISLGPPYGLCLTLQYLNGVCLISRNIDLIVWFGQLAAMEGFQLSRLYYCFSQQQVHSNKVRVHVNVVMCYT